MSSHSKQRWHHGGSCDETCCNFPEPEGIQFPLHTRRKSGFLHLRNIFLFSGRVNAELLTNPNFSLVKPLPLWREEELETFRSTFQCKSFHTEDGENDVGEDSTDPEQLERKQLKKTY